MPEDVAHKRERRPALPRDNKSASLYFHMCMTKPEPADVQQRFERSRQHHQPDNDICNERPLAGRKLQGFRPSELLNIYISGGYHIEHTQCRRDRRLRFLLHGDADPGQQQ